MRHDVDRILDMVEMCDLLIEHASDSQRLEQDPVTQAAAQRWIEVIGEAASHVSDALKRSRPDVAWREIIGIRIILAHGCFHIEDDNIGNVISNDIPVLRSQLQRILDLLTDIGRPQSPTER